MQIFSQLYQIQYTCYRYRFGLWYIRLYSIIKTWISTKYEIFHQILLNKIIALLFILA